MVVFCTRLSSLAALLLVSFSCPAGGSTLPGQGRVVRTSGPAVSETALAQPLEKPVALAALPEVAGFIDAMVKKHAFVRADLKALFGEVQIRDDILAAISRPAEAKPWSQYRQLFVTDERIRLGMEFWDKNASTLEAAQREFGVPPQYIVGIIGVETRYGRQSGGYRVMDALSTLAFDFPPRSAFFRDQLEDFLLMAREEHVEPLSLKGSYAGAMGQPQFMPSSFRKYAVDFDGDGHRDLWNDTADAIGSVANYFHAHGWRADAPVVHRAQVIGPDSDYDALVVRTTEPTTPFAVLGAKGVSVDATIPPDEKVSLLRLDGENGPEYWVARHNFFVITRYNRSALYAMAVHQLGEAVAKLRNPPSQSPPTVSKTNASGKKDDGKFWCPVCD